jgi:FGGY-family pentulose kinase
MERNMPYRKPSRQQSRQMSVDPHNEVKVIQNHYIGIDVGTGSARACIMNEKGDIVGLASENIGLWQPETGYYVRRGNWCCYHISTDSMLQEQSVTDIWKCICNSVQRAMNQHNIDPETVRGIGFDATCSLTVFNEETGEPQSVTGPKFDNADGNDRNVILWLDHRPVEETKKVNATKHNLLRYVGGTMSIEMEMPKILWLKNNMPPELFAKCNFYDLGDALTKMATGQDARSFCSTVCKQGYVPVGVDGSEKGWQEDFLKEIGLEDLIQDDCRRLGGINGLVRERSLRVSNTVQAY